MGVQWLNNPFAIAVDSAIELWPGIAVEIQFVPPDALGGAFGCTTFPDDGSTPLIDIDAGLPVTAAVEILAHELAHVATGGEDHGPKWEAAFAAIHQLFERKAAE